MNFFVPMLLHRQGTAGATPPRAKGGDAATHRCPLPSRLSLARKSLVGFTQHAVARTVRRRTARVDGFTLTVPVVVAGLVHHGTNPAVER